MLPRVVADDAVIGDDHLVIVCGGMGHESGMTDEDDLIWLAVVDLCEELGPVEHRASRWADKPALFLGRREVAHAEAPGRIDPRITAKGWRAQAAAFTGDPSIHHDQAARVPLRLHA